MKLARKMDMNLGVIMVKIFRVEFFIVMIISIAMAIDCSLLSGRISFTTNSNFWCQDLQNKSIKACNNKKAENNKNR